jgi:MBG domain (YGX type)
MMACEEYQRTSACCSTAATTSSPAGDYTIVIASGNLAAKNGNYTFTFANGLLIIFNPANRNDPHCDGFGSYRPNPQWDAGNWPDSSSYNYYWGSGRGDPSITLWQ